MANVLVSQKFELLMGLRADSCQWEVPGGKVDMENLEDACKREMMEESGIELLGKPAFLGYGEEVDERPQFYGRRYLMMYFGWSDWNGFPQIIEDDKCLKWRWFPIDEIPADNVTTGTLSLLKNILPLYLAVLAKKEQARLEQEALWEKTRDKEKAQITEYPHEAT